MEMDENLKTAIKHKTIKRGYDRDGDLVPYGGRLYYVNIRKDVVAEQDIKKIRSNYGK